MAPAKAAISRVFTDKIESARVSRIAAILEKRVGIKFLGQDVGEIRAVSKIRQRAKTAEGLGFKHIFAAEKTESVEVVKDIASLIKKIF